MVHKLLIEIDYKLTKKQFGNILKKREFPRGIDIPLTLGATNLGDTTFPGGKLTEISFVYEGEMKSYHQPEEAIISSINPNVKKTIYTWNETMYLDGLVWVHCNIKSNDEQPIEYYQTKKGTAIQGEWKNVFIVVNKENLMIIQLLNEMNKKINELLEK